MKIASLRRPGAGALSRAACAAALALLEAMPAHAARPMITDDARMVDPKSCQVETWTKINRGSVEYWALPACNPLGLFELTYGAAHLHPEGGTRETSDIVLQVKTIFKPLETDGWGVGLALGHVAHPNVRTQRNQVGDVYWYVPASRSLLSDRVVLHLNAGMLRLESLEETRRTWGVGVEALASEGLYLIAESFGQNRGRPFWQAGVRWWMVPGHVQLDATVGDRLGAGQELARGPERWLSLGLRLLSPPFLP